ncbi:hypothetical protein SLA2020_198440 [Shorea laevis]
MEDATFSPGSMLAVPLDSAMDFDFVDELLLDGCWLETTDGSEFPNPSTSTSNAFFDTPFVWPTSENNNGISCTGASQISYQEERKGSLLPENSNLNESQERSSVNPQFRQKMVDFDRSYNQPGNYLAEVSEPIRKWWIAPRANPSPATSVMQRLIQALECLKDFAIDKDVLVQLWVPVNRGGRRFLTTDDQPFSLNQNSWRLANYRDISARYHFPAEEDSKDMAGMPGRVFLDKVPEWTPDVRFFRSDEYPRIDHARQCDVHGTFALPVFEQGSSICLGVIEVVTTTQKIKYRPELENVCKALEAVNLTSSIASSSQNVKVCSKSYEATLPEIKEVLRCACETQKLPLAQTWVPCIQQGKEGCPHSNENYVNCVSTIDDACYIAYPGIQAFHEACSEYHLLKGQGVVGEAFMTNQPCFSPNITAYKKTEYPLSHHATMFGLQGAVAIRLRCIHTGTADFVLEFFLPTDCTDIEEQRKMLHSLSIIIQNVCHGLRVITDEELAKETDFLVSEVIVPSYGIPNREEILKGEHADTRRYSQENSSLTSPDEVQQGSKVASVFQNDQTSPMLNKNVAEVRQHHEDSYLKGSIEHGGDSTFNEVGFSSLTGGKLGEKRRTKAEKAITLEVLRQYFAGSLKDAAKSLGVCPTTLKRICRQHGIQRWPSRKLKKVDHSLRKLQNVIDSVQGASGTFQIGSFYANFPELASPKLSGSSTFATSKLCNHPNLSSRQPEGGILRSQAAISNSHSSSCSQSSGSSQSCSSERPQYFTSKVSGSEDLMLGESLGDGVLKRVRSHAELEASGREGIKQLPRSQSQKSLKELSTSESLLRRGNGQIAQEVIAQRVKVTYGDEKIRFRMQNQWRFEDLLKEIARRFNIDDITRYDLKYLDDDSEWVLLTCDADLEECIDVCQSLEGNPIRLKLQVSHNHLNRYSRTHGPS